MLTRRHLLAGAAALAAGVPEAGAQSTYASQPIHILVGYAAGGGVDIVARLLQEPMKSALGPANHHRKPHGRERHAGDGGGRQGSARRLHAAGVRIRRSRHQSFPVQGADVLRSGQRTGADRTDRHRALRGRRRRDDTRPQSERADRLHQGQSRQTVILVVRYRQSAAACRRTDEHAWRAPRCCTCPIAARRRR